MKTLLTVAMLVGASALVGAQERLSDQLRKGIVQEEVNQNLTKAIEAYQAIVAQFDEERKTAASALYRLAECSRKAGKREQALAAYQRVVREFADQTALVDSSRRQLTTTFGLAPSAGAERDRTAAGAVAARERTRESLLRERATAEERVKWFEQRIKAGVVSRDSKEYQQLQKEFEQATRQFEDAGANLFELQKLTQRYAEQMAEREATKVAERDAQVMTQRMIKSVEAEIALIQERLTAMEKKSQAGVMASDSPELLQLRRDLLGLQRKLDELRSGLKR